MSKGTTIAYLKLTETGFRFDPAPGQEKQLKQLLDEMDVPAETVLTPLGPPRHPDDISGIPTKPGLPNVLDVPAGECDVANCSCRKYQ